MRGSRSVNTIEAYEVFGKGGRSHLCGPSLAVGNWVNLPSMLSARRFFKFICVNFIDEISILFTKFRLYS